MKRGDVLRLRAIRNYGVPGETSMISEDFTPADKRDVFVVVLLGVERRDGSQRLDPVAAMKALGWTPPEGLEDNADEG